MKALSTSFLFTFLIIPSMGFAFFIIVTQPNPELPNRPGAQQEPGSPRSPAERMQGRRRVY